MVGRSSTGLRGRSKPACCTSSTYVFFDLARASTALPRPPSGYGLPALVMPDSMLPAYSLSPGAVPVRDARCATVMWAPLSAMMISLARRLTPRDAHQQFPGRYRAFSPSNRAFHCAGFGVLALVASLGRSTASGHRWARNSSSAGFAARTFRSGALAGAGGKCSSKTEGVPGDLDRPDLADMDDPDLPAVYALAEEGPRRAGLTVQPVGLSAALPYPLMKGAPVPPL